MDFNMERARLPIDPSFVNESETLGVNNTSRLWIWFCGWLRALASSSESFCEENYLSKELIFCRNLERTVFSPLLEYLFSRILWDVYYDKDLYLYDRVGYLGKAGL